MVSRVRCRFGSLSMKFHRTSIGLAVACLSALAVGAAAPVLAQPAAGYPVNAADVQAADWPARVGRLAEVQGAVWFYDREDGAWAQAQPNRPLTSGDRLSVEANGRALLRIGATSLRLSGGADLTLRRIDDQVIAIDLDGGSLALTVPAVDAATPLEVSTAEGRFTPRGAGLYRIDRRGDASEGSALRGQLVFDGSDSQLAVSAGQHAQFWLQGTPPSTHFRLLDLERDAFASWAQQGDVDIQRSQTARYVSPEMTGWEDLDRYGSWTNSPEYGHVWIPANVSASWAPYQDGRWVWALPWGWTWVDAAPWGFAPFHYGRWVRWGPRWVWTPGERGHRPHFAPALVSWTPPPQREWRDHRPPPPSRWVPLLPREVYRPPAHPVMPPAPRDRAIPLPPHRGQDHGRRVGDVPDRPWPIRPGFDRPNTGQPMGDRPGHDRGQGDRRPGNPPGVVTLPAVPAPSPVPQAAPQQPQVNFPAPQPHDRRVPRPPPNRQPPPAAPVVQPSPAPVVAPVIPHRPERTRPEVGHVEPRPQVSPPAAPPANPPAAAPEPRRRVPEQPEPQGQERKNQR
jgi:hypothetical protein